MALRNALSFVDRMIKDPEFRDECTHYKTQELLLEAQDFNLNEFEDAINTNLFKCQTYEMAEHYQQLKMWMIVF